MAIENKLKNIINKSHSAMRAFPADEQMHTHKPVLDNI